MCYLHKDKGIFWALLDAIKRGDSKEQKRLEELINSDKNISHDFFEGFKNAKPDEVRTVFMNSKLEF